MCSSRSTALGASAYATSPNVPSRVLICLGLDRIASQMRSAASSRERGERVVDRRRCDHRRAHERHVDGGEVTLSAMTSEDTTQRERIECSLGGDVGREARRIGLHADRRHVDDVTALRARIAAASTRIRATAPR